MWEWLKIRWRAVFRRAEVDRDLEEELQAHVEREIQRNIANGMSPQDARQAALRGFGGVDQVKEESRDARGVRLIDELRQDVRHGIRVLAKAPRFTIPAVVALALAIGANSAIFSLVNGILLRQLPFADPDQLFWMASVRPDRNDAPFSLPEYMDYREQNRSFEHLAAYGNVGMNLTGSGDTERLQGIRASANLFAMLGIRASLGRTLQPDDDVPKNPRVVVLGHGLWQRRFGGDASILGRPLMLNGVSYQVVGILPPEFIFPERTAELVIPLVPDTDPWRHARSSVNFLRVMGRVRRGVSQRQAEEDMTGICNRLRQQFPVEQARDIGVRITSLHGVLVANYQQSLWVLLAAMGLVLVTASANLANLMLARASARQHEMALRQALGASRGRTIRQLLTEGALLAGTGGAVGLAIASYCLRLLLSLAPADMPRTAEVAIDGTVLLWTLGIATLAGLVFSVAPALVASSASSSEAMKAPGRGLSEGKRPRRLRSALVVVEVGVATVLLVIGGLLLKSFDRLQQVNPGFNSKGVLVARLSLPAAGYPNRDAVNVFCDKLRARIATMPGVESVGVISIAPMSGVLATVPFTVEGNPPESPDKTPYAMYRIISTGYLRTMQIRVMQGRDFTEQDTATTRPVAIINQTLARQYFPEGNAVGGQLRIDDNNTGPRLVDVVGVIGDVKQSGLDQSPTWDIYAPLPQLHPDGTPWMRNNMFWMMRTAQEPMALAAPFRNALREVAYDVPASTIQPMQNYLAAWAAPREFNLQVLLVFAAAGLMLAASGTYSVLSYTVAMRTREIGIRMALGAQKRSILLQVVRHGVILTVAGVAVGLGAALSLGQVIRGSLFQVGVFDFATYATIAGLLLAISALACYLPARRATLVDPLIALRYE